MSAESACIGAIIVDYHTGYLLSALLDALAAEPAIAETLIVDNGGGGGALRQAAESRRVQVLAQGKNLGFAAAVNLAAAELSLPWWLVINPDVRPEPGSVGALLAAAQRCSAPLAGPRAFWDDECRWRLPPAAGDSWWLTLGARAVGHGLDAGLMSFYSDLRHERFWRHTEPFFEPFLSGGCLLVRNDPELFPEGRIFDDRYFVYYEDTDLCARLLCEQRLMLCVPGARIVHYWDQAPRTEKPRFMRDASERFFDKHYGGQPRWEGFDASAAGVELLDLGRLSTPPSFEAPAIAGPSALQLEVAVGPRFLPFVQRDFVPNEPAFTPAHWRRLAPREYFARLRTPDSPYPLRSWRWVKDAL